MLVKLRILGPIGVSLAKCSNQGCGNGAEGVTLLNQSTVLLQCARRKTTAVSNKDTKFSSKINVRRIMAEEAKTWMSIGDIKVHPWSISGLESSVAVLWDDFSCSFDMGYPTKPAVKCPNVFISHGHIDHVSGIMQHAARRNLYKMRPATYFMPGHLVAPARQMAQSFAALHGPDQNFTDIQLKALDGEDSVTLPGGRIVVPFPTVHRVPSQGYIVYQRKNKLKEEYQGLPPQEIGALVKQGTEINDVTLTPMVAYTGDTTFELFLSPPHPDLLKVKLLITEATYIDADIDREGKTAEQRARDRGHTHLSEIVQHWDLFENVGDVLLVHFSDKYPTGYIRRQVERIVPEHIRPRIHLGTLMKSILG